MTTKINPSPSDKTVEKSLTEIVNAIASDGGDYETKINKEMLTSAESHVERIIEAYITTVEGSPCSYDKTSFVVKKMKEAIATGKNIGLQETYADYYKRIGKPLPYDREFCKDSLFIHSPDTIKDTKEAFDIVYAIETINGIPDLFKRKKKEMIPVRARERKDAIAYHAQEAAKAKPFDGSLTVMEYVDSKEPYMLTVYDSSTGKQLAHISKGFGFGQTPDDEYAGEIPDSIGKMKIAKLDELVDEGYAAELAKHGAPASMTVSKVYVDAGKLGEWE